MLNVALFGNPNTGKTSLFNIITGSYEYVGNWTGVTVEKKIGALKDVKAQVIDLPGIYSLNPLSKDEGVATQFLLSEEFSSILNIVDASQLERNLYLTVQLMEFGKPLLIGLNMMDVAKGRGMKIDHRKLAVILGVPVVCIVARTGEGCKQIPQRITGMINYKATPLHIDYGFLVESSIQRLVQRIPEIGLPKRWLATQFLEGNPIVAKQLEASIEPSWLEKVYQETEKNLIRQNKAKSLQHHMRKVRGNFISRILNQCLTRTKKDGTTMTDRIDQIVTNRVLGVPIFLAVMMLTFKLTFDWLGTPISDMLDAFLSGPLTDKAKLFLDLMGASPFIEAVILNGIIAGVGGVLVFVPQIFILFFLISFIEDSGYMARVAMVMDRAMEVVGLNGKAFIPMVIGFGCNVPGVMAARTIEQPKERLLTILLTPLMSCSARLAVYSLFVGAFFKKSQSLVVFSLYLLGIVVAMVLAKLFSMVLMKDEGKMFVIELPPYRVPQWQTLFRSTWEKGKGFVRKAGTFIFGGSVFIWFLSYAGPSGFNVKMDDSFLAIIGGVLSPILHPIGFGNWQAGAALLTGFMAKEVVVATMNIIYHAPDLTVLQHTMGTFFTPLQAYSFLVFVLLYVPCLATVGAIRKETGSARWTCFSVGYALTVAYVLCLLIYQGGKLLGFE